METLACEKPSCAVRISIGSNSTYHRSFIMLNNDAGLFNVVVTQQVLCEPFHCFIKHFRFMALEQVFGIWNYMHFMWRLEVVQEFVRHVQDDLVVAADDEEAWKLHTLGKLIVVLPRCGPENAGLEFNFAQ